MRAEDLLQAMLQVFVNKRLDKKLICVEVTEFLLLKIKKAKTVIPERKEGNGGHVLGAIFYHFGGNNGQGGN